MLSGIEETAAKAGYNILVAQSNEEYEREVKIVHSFLAARVCGVITSLAKDTSQYDHYQELLDNNIPIVFYDRICTGINTERVVVDDYAGSFAAVEYMYRTGANSSFLQLPPLTSKSPRPAERLSGCHEEVPDSGRPEHDQAV